MVPRRVPGLFEGPDDGQSPAQSLSQLTGVAIGTVRSISSLPFTRTSWKRTSSRLQFWPSAPVAVGANRMSYDIRAYEPSGATSVSFVLKKYDVRWLCRSRASVMPSAKRAEYSD